MLAKDDFTLKKWSEWINYENEKLKQLLTEVILFDAICYTILLNTQYGLKGSQLQDVSCHGVLNTM